MAQALGDGEIGWGALMSIDSEWLVSLEKEIGLGRFDTKDVSRALEADLLELGQHFPDDLCQFALIPLEEE